MYIILKYVNNTKINWQQTNIKIASCLAFFNFIKNFLIIRIFCSKSVQTYKNCSVLKRKISIWWSSFTFNFWILKFYSNIVVKIDISEALIICTVQKDHWFLKRRYYLKISWTSKKNSLISSWIVDPISLFFSV